MKNLVLDHSPINPHGVSILFLKSIQLVSWHSWNKARTNGWWSTRQYVLFKHLVRLHMIFRWVYSVDIRKAKPSLDAFLALAGKYVSPFACPNNLMELHRFQVLVWAIPAFLSNFSQYCQIFFIQILLVQLHHAHPLTPLFKNVDVDERMIIICDGFHTWSYLLAQNFREASLNCPCENNSK